MKASHFSKDIQEFLELLTKHSVRYVIVGGEAVIYYGYARLTGDVDFFYESSRENALHLYGALDEFWEGEIPGIKTFEELMESGTILQFGVPPNRLDLVNRIDGVTFEEVWTGKTTERIEIQGQTFQVNFIGLEQLIKNKEKIGRAKDMEDLRYLKKAMEKQKNADS
jgi:predicted nucleotidyltransferase